MIREFSAATAAWIKRVVTQPLDELNRWQATVRFAYDLGRFGARQLHHDRAFQMAGALAFRTLFGLLPVLVVGTVLVRALGMVEHFREPLDRVLGFWGLQQVQVLSPTGGGGPSISLAEWLHGRVIEAGQMNWSAIGWVGVAVTFYAAISLMGTIEASFNVVYRARRGRAWTFRLAVYWFALTISPLVVVASSRISRYFEGWLDLLRGMPWLSPTVGFLWGVLAIWFLMLVVYRIVPNTRVEMRPAAIGALVAAVSLELGKRTMGIYLSEALSVNQLYGSLGLVPLFMLWVYLMWLAVLFGLQVSATLQHLRGRRLAELEQQEIESTLVEPAVVVLLMQHVCDHFGRGEPIRVGDAARLSGLPEPVVELILEHLVAAGLVYRLAEGASAFTLSRPPDALTVEQLLDVGFQAVARGAVEQDERFASVRLRLQRAQREAVAGLRLSELVHPPLAG